MATCADQRFCTNYMNNTAMEKLQNDLEELQVWCQESEEASCLMNVSDSIPDGHAVVDCGAAMDCTGEETAARTAQALEAQGENRALECVDKIQDFHVWERASHIGHVSQ